MIPILYDSAETTFSNNGICRLPEMITAVVTEERNGVYEIDFEYPITGANYDQIQLGRVIACYHEDSEDVQPFDIVSATKPINGVVSFHGVHISYRLSGHVTSGTNINSLADAMNLLTQATPALDGWTFSADFTSSAYMAAGDGVPRSIRQMLGGVEGSILDTYGGEYEFNKTNVILHSARGSVAGFSIRYGVNMVDYSDETDYSESYNSVVPYWIGDDNGNEVVVQASRVDSGATMYNGRTECIPLDLSDKFETKPTAAQLQTMATSYMSSNQTHLPKRTITVDFINLSDSVEYAEYEQLMSCKLCDEIRVVFPRYGMDGLYKIVKTEYDVLKERYQAMELGTLSTTLSEALGVGKESAFQSGAGDGNLNVAGNITAGGTIIAEGRISGQRETVYDNSSGWTPSTSAGTTVNGAIANYSQVEVHLSDGSFGICNLSWSNGTGVILGMLSYPYNDYIYVNTVNFQLTASGSNYTLLVPSDVQMPANYRIGTSVLKVTSVRKLTKIVGLVSTHE